MSHDEFRQAALDYHRSSPPGKITVSATKPMLTQRDLALAYSPGVAFACEEIVKDPNAASELTARGNLVAVISNGTAVLGLGNIGALAGKPVMEGKGVLFKKFAGIDVFDIEVDETDPDKLVDIIASLEPTFGGINLEDIKAPECFIVERKLRERMKIPVFHDDQHGTAIIVGAAIVNALEIAGKRIEDVKLATTGAGAAGIACLDMLVALGLKPEHILAFDRDGVIHSGRTDLDDAKARYARDTPARSLAEIVDGADVFLGLSAGGILTPAMVETMAPNPVILALANPYPEIMPEEARRVRPDAIIATGRSDFPNQVNNAVCFPYIFRGALDVGATGINEAMKLACVHAIAQLAKEEASDLGSAYGEEIPSFGRDYIIPRPFDPRLLTIVAPAVAQAAMDTGVARRPIPDMDAYRTELRSRVDPSAALMQKISSAVRSGPNKRVVFAEGEEPSVIRAAWGFKQAELGTPVLVGREDLIRQNAQEAGLNFDELGIEITNARVSGRNVEYTDWLYEKLQRRGYLRRDVQRMINQDRNYFAATLVAKGRADAMVAGVTRNFNMALKEVQRVLDVDDTLIGLSILLAKGRTLFVADTSIHELPGAEELAEIAIKAAGTVRRLGRNPRVAFLSYSTFGNPPGDRGEKVREAIRILDRKGVDFEYEGEMPPEVALDPHGHPAYAFNRLTKPANTLVMPAIHSAAISTKLVQALGGATLIGPLLVGLEKSVQIVSLGASVNEILTAATFAAYDAGPTFQGSGLTSAPRPPAALFEPNES